MQWEKVKKAGLVPSPRTSVALATHKKRAILFGGVTDQHGRGDHMFSTLHDELYQFNLDSRRWYPVAVKAPAKALAKADKQAEAPHPPQNGLTNAEGTCERAAATSPDQTSQSEEVSAASSRGRGVGGNTEQVQPDLADKLSRAGVDKESALYKAAARIQSRFRGYTVRKVRLVQGSISVPAGIRQQISV